MEEAATGLTAAAQIAHLRRRIAQAPGNPAPRNKLADLLDAQGQRDEAIAVLRETAGSFPKNQKAREHLKALLGGPDRRLVQEAPPEPVSLLPELKIEQAILASPATREALPQEMEPANAMVTETWDMPIRLVRWRPSAELIASFSILLVLGVAWHAWRLLPESHLLQKPAVIVMEAAMPATASVAVASLAPIAPVFIQATPVEHPLPPPAPAMRASATPKLPDPMPLSVMVLYERRGLAPSRAASRMAAKLESLHVAVSGTRIVAGAGAAGIGYFYDEDRNAAESLRRRMPDLPGGIRLISGAARAAQQPGSVAVVVP